MTNWLPISELADVFRLGTHDVLDVLAQLGLAQGSHGSTLALRHSLAVTSTADGATTTLWHPDVVRLLEGVGMVQALPETMCDREPDGWESTLFGEDLAIADVRDAELGVEGGFDIDDEPAGVSGKESQARGTSRSDGPVGMIAPGFDAVIATDGACSGNPGPGGWAWVEQVSGARAAGGAASTTNNVMELTALIEGLEFVGPDVDLLIRCDSQYVINTMTKWAPGWRRKGWKKSDGKPVKNRELVERLLTLYEGRRGRTEVEWVKGHAGDAANELCDRLAVEQSQKFARR
ncbi:ribonuclease HI [Arcanobacterium haemolyticum]|nr:ribonuclease HI [Arcanobacterium haemolyticum]